MRLRCRRQTTGTTLIRTILGTNTRHLANTVRPSLIIGDAIAARAIRVGGAARAKRRTGRGGRNESEESEKREEAHG